MMFGGTPGSGDGGGAGDQPMVASRGVGVGAAVLFAATKLPENVVFGGGEAADGLLLLLLVGGRRDGRRQTDVDVVGVAA